MARKLKNFIDGFMKYTEGRGSPEIYRKWTAIFTIAAVCERKVWLTTAKGKLYPNQYMLLVGGAGIGKSLCTNTAADLVNEVKTPETPLFLAPTSVTKASLIDCLNAAERRIIRPMETPSIISFNSLTIIPNEFGVFLPAYDTEFMSTLTDLWDCGRYAETRRTSKINIEIPHTQLNLLSATTPAQLSGILPEGAWEQGFMSRMLLIYSGDITHTDIFAKLDHDGVLYKNLVEDLRDIYRCYGEITVSDEAKLAINEWAAGGAAPVPDHPKLVSYCARRPAHLLKLMMVAAIANDSERVITIDHFAEAYDWLMQLEAAMPDVFKSMKVGGDARAIEECWHFAYQLWMKNKEPIAEHRIFAFLQERVPVHNIERLLDVMVRAKLFDKAYTPSGAMGYNPKARKVA